MKGKVADAGPAEWNSMGKIIGLKTLVYVLLTSTSPKVRASEAKCPRLWLSYSVSSKGADDSMSLLRLLQG